LPRYRPQSARGLLSPVSSHGFTLIELLLVCAILASLSYLAWGAYIDVDRRAADELAQADLLKLAGALQRFHDDTGYWPGEGPFRMAVEGCANLKDGAIDPDYVGPDPAAAVGSAAAGDSSDLARRGLWFASPANFTLLFEAPRLCAEHPLAALASWNPETRRGWRGPYLPLANRHWVDVWATLGESNPAGGKLENLPSFGTGPVFPPGGGGNLAPCNRGLEDCFLGWRSLPKPIDGGASVADNMGYLPESHELARHARPFLFFLMAPSEDPTDPSKPPRRLPRVVYWGADGRYGGTNPIAPCLPHAADPDGDGRDDRVICL
jgi:prepilin-type N-terminal cleavage/methylation domain-containing protein